MKKILFLCLLLLFISCDGNPCVVYVYDCENLDGFIAPKIYWIKFYPSKAKVGDTVMVMYEKEVKIKNLNYENDFEITDDGKIKYIGKYWDPYFSFGQQTKILDNILYICPQKDRKSLIEVNDFISFSNSFATSSDNEIVTLEFKVPDEAKSGYLYVDRDFFQFDNTVFSEEKLIVVDENGKEITE